MSFDEDVADATPTIVAEARPAIEALLADHDSGA